MNILSAKCKQACVRKINSKSNHVKVDNLYKMIASSITICMVSATTLDSLLSKALCPIKNM